MDFGVILRQLRKDRCLTQIELANLIGVSAATVIKWENVGRSPRSNNLKKIADVLQVDVSYFFQNKEDVVRPSFGEIMCTKRLESDLTHKQLADKLGMDDETLRKYESNRLNPTWKTADKIMNALNNGAEYVKTARKRADLSQEEFGKQIGLSKSGISNLENEKRKVNQRHVKLIESVFPNETEIKTESSETISEILLDISKKFMMLAERLR